MKLVFPLVFIFFYNLQLKAVNSYQGLGSDQTVVSAATKEHHIASNPLVKSLESSEEEGRILRPWKGEDKEAPDYSITNCVSKLSMDRNARNAKMTIEALAVLCSIRETEGNFNNIKNYAYNSEKDQLLILRDNNPKVYEISNGQRLKQSKNPKPISNQKLRPLS